tara:strand:- start:514 stop:1449 length:936 start_codon:yes stop_codon:yes gene_type:complete
MFINKPKFWNNSGFSFWSIVLYPISILYLLIFNIKKIKSSKKYKIPIVCIGNIYLGGTGKTPLALEIFNISKSLGKNPAFVKKYYSYLEDEINMLKKKGEVFVSKNRIDAVESLIINKNDIAILDDGFQDFSIKKDLSIVCFNQKQWLGNRMVIPSGPLRETLSSIKRADCVFINGQKNNEIEKEIYKQNKNIEIYYSKYKPLDLDKFKNKKIIAFAGIGNPTNFFDLLEEENLNLLNKFSFPDHYNYTNKDLEKLIVYSKETNSTLLTTEKDYLRINDNYKKKIEFMKIEIEIENKNNFINLIKKSYEKN